MVARGVNVDGGELPMGGVDFSLSQNTLPLSR